jgi:SSS family solute:Na+ symporter
MVSELHFKKTVYPLHVGSFTVNGYAAIWALVVNLAIAGVLTLVLPRLGILRGVDRAFDDEHGPAQ